jgi:hypothetical protein
MPDSDQSEDYDCLHSVMAGSAGLCKKCLKEWQEYVEYAKRKQKRISAYVDRGMEPPMFWEPGDPEVEATLDQQ